MLSFGHGQTDIHIWVINNNNDKRLQQDDNGNLANGIRANGRLVDNNKLRVYSSLIHTI